MARITVEDCLQNVDNRFELVVAASKRARQLSEGKQANVEEQNDKTTVIALREIAAGLINMTNINQQEKEDEATNLLSEFTAGE